MNSNDRPELRINGDLNPLDDLAFGVDWAVVHLHDRSAGSDGPESDGRADSSREDLDDRGIRRDGHVLSLL